LPDIWVIFKWASFLSGKHSGLHIFMVVWNMHPKGRHLPTMDAWSTLWSPQRCARAMGHGHGSKPLIFQHFKSERPYKVMPHN
jgi:hypothetical protein